MTRTSRQRTELDKILTDLKEYFYEITTDCPYGLSHQAIYRQARFGIMPERLFELLLHAGFRRNGNIMYSMKCPDCHACQPIKLNPDELAANRNQKRVLKKNSEMEYEIAPLEMSRENLRLLDKFLKTRYPERSSRAEDYYAGFFINSFGYSMEIRYRLGGRLVGVAIVDMGHDWLNAVHFFFDPAESKRSPGTYNILSLADLCLAQNIKNLYLGYWIKNVSSMAYKGSFKPHYLMQSGAWLKIC